MSDETHSFLARFKALVAKSEDIERHTFQDVDAYVEYLRDVSKQTDTIFVSGAELKVKKTKSA